MKYMNKRIGRRAAMIPAVLLTACFLCFGSVISEAAAADEEVILSDDSSDFVLLTEAVPDAILEIRYYSTYNFVGDRIDGYEEPLAFRRKQPRH